jgi:hypothetical protein
VDLTQSYLGVVPDAARARYRWAETRNAMAVLATTNPDAFGDLLHVLGTFAVDVQRDLVERGRNETKAAALLNELFRARGWREGSFELSFTSRRTVQPYRKAGETAPLVVETEVSAASYKIDNLKDRVAVDVEWHAKDGNLDRDIAAYRALYEAGMIDAAAIITVVQADMKQWARELDPGTT